MTMRSISRLDLERSDQIRQTTQHSDENKEPTPIHPHPHPRPHPHYPPYHIPHTPYPIPPQKPNNSKYLPIAHLLTHSQLIPADPNMEEPAHSKTQNKAIAPDHRSRATAAEQNPTSKNFQPGKSQKHMIKMHMYVVPAGKRKEKN